MQLSLPVGTFNASVLNSADQIILLAAGTGWFALAIIKELKQNCIYL